MNKNEENFNQIIKVENLLEYNKNLEIHDNTFNKLMYIYSLGLRQLENSINNIKDEYDILYEYNLIESSIARIKKPESIIKKMNNRKLDLTYKNMINNINDIAGIRIICPLEKDVYSVRNILKKMDGINIIKEKDYIKNPKKSGYSSYHIIAEINLRLSEKNTYIKVEIQIRTLAMDYWASMEHKMVYKKNGQIDKKQQSKWKECAKLISKLDNAMMKINN